MTFAPGLFVRFKSQLTSTQDVLAACPAQTPDFAVEVQAEEATTIAGVLELWPTALVIFSMPETQNLLVSAAGSALWDGVKTTAAVLWYGIKGRTVTWVSASRSQEVPAKLCIELRSPNGASARFFVEAGDQIDDFPGMCDRALAQFFEHEARVARGDPLEELGHPDMPDQLRRRQKAHFRWFDKICEWKAFNWIDVARRRAPGATGQEPPGQDRG